MSRSAVVRPVDNAHKPARSPRSQLADWLPDRWKQRQSACLTSVENLRLTYHSGMTCRQSFFCQIFGTNYLNLTMRDYCCLNDNDCAAVAGATRE
jgi:hypothetical protein